MMTDKTEIRRRRREQAKRMSPSGFREASRSIQERVTRLPAWKKAGTVMLYVSAPTEPETGDLIRRAAEEGKRVLLPRCTGPAEMEPVPFTGWDRMKQNAFGIPEPTGKAADDQPEVILVPCVAASAGGGRLGHGAGYYDRFLRNQPGLKVCLCFQAFLTEELPMEEDDVFMDIVLTEEAEYRRE